MRKVSAFTLGLLMLLSVSVAWAGGEAEQEEGPQEIQFIQWWEPEMTEGSFAEVIAGFEEEYPEISVEPVSAPYSQVQDQIMTQSAGGVLPEVVGVDPGRIRNFMQQGIVRQLDSYVEEAGIDLDNHAAKPVDGEHWMLPVVSFVYPLFYNIDMLEEAGYDSPPETREEFREMAEAVTNADEGRYGWSIMLDLGQPTGVPTDIFGWYWNAGYDVMEDGQPNLDTTGMVETLQFINDLQQDGLIVPGALSRSEPEKLEEFVNERTAFMVSSTAHIAMIRDRNPDLNFGIAPVPGPSDYDGPPASRVVGWDIGISGGASEAEADAAWKVIEYIMGPDVSAFIAENANALPGNLTASPDFGGSEMHESAYSIYQEADLYSPLVGLPDTQDLQRLFAEEVHALFEGEQTAEETAAAAQEHWNSIILGDD